MKAADRSFRNFMSKKRHPYRYLRVLWWKFWVNFSIRVLDAFDWHLKMLGWTKRERKDMWKEFHKDPRFRTEVLNKMTQKY